jgi:N6-adenosine-specific RNA methylase IME4
MADPFPDLPRGHYGAILADPPWHFKFWWGGHEARKPAGSRRDEVGPPYQTMKEDELSSLPVGELAAPDCVLFLWTCWPTIEQSLRILNRWGFEFKTCAFAWMKADPYRLFADDKTPYAGMGYWTRANTEPCLLATRGHPKRLNADVRQGIIAPRREHSRKPEGVHERIERLVAGPYLELFARQRRPGWDCWGNEVDKFGGEYDAHRDVEGSFSEAYRVIRQRMAAGGPGWTPRCDQTDDLFKESKSEGEQS